MASENMRIRVILTSITLALFDRFKELKRVLFYARAGKFKFGQKSDRVRFILHCDRMKICTQTCQFGELPKKK